MPALDELAGGRVDRHLARDEHEPGGDDRLRVRGAGHRCGRRVGADDGLAHAGSMAPIAAPPIVRSASSTVQEMHVKIGVSRSV